MLSVLSFAQDSAGDGFVLLRRPESEGFWAQTLCISAGKGLGVEVSGSEVPWQSVFRLFLLPEALLPYILGFLPQFPHTNTNGLLLASRMICKDSVGEGALET